MDLKSGTVSMLIQPVLAYVGSPKYSPDMESIMYLSTEKVDGSWKDVIYTTDAEGKNRTRIFEHHRNIIRAAFAMNGERIYFTTASDIGNSSPMVKPHPRGNMDIFSINVEGDDVREETDFNGHTMGRDLELDQTGKYIYFQKLEPYPDFLSAEEMPNPRVHHDKCGPFRMNLETNELQSLVPINYQELYLIDRNFFFADFVHPVPDSSDSSIFLISASAVYKMDMNTMQARLFYQQPTEEVKKKYRILYWSPIGNSSEYLLLKQTARKENAFFVVDQNGEVVKTIVPDMNGFLHEFDI